MWRLVLVSVWLGLSCGLQPGFEYQYRYSGRLATGITDIRQQFAAVGIQADVTLQGAEDHAFVIKFDNVRVGDFHGDHNCDLRDPIPISYQALQDGTDLLQRPFRVSLHSEEAAYLEVPAEELSWITNIRRSIVDILPFATLWREIQESETRFARPNFGKVEQLMGGRCMNWYSVTKMSDEETIRQVRDLRIEEDVQLDEAPASASYKTKRELSDGAKTSDQQSSSGSINSGLWTVTRTVDYDMCSHLVEVKVNGNKNVEDLISRTSVARYVIRGGDAKGIRLEKAVVEGAISAFTSDSSHDHIDTFTNQTLELKTVRLISSHINIDYESHRIHSWQYEVDPIPSSGQEAPGYYRDFEERLTGTQRKCNDLNAIQKILFSALNDVSSGSTSLVVAMDTVVKAISYLSYGQIDTIYEQLQEKYASATSKGDAAEILSTRQNIYNFKFALVLSGTEPAVKFLLDMMEDRVIRMEDETIFNFFRQIHVTLKAPSLVPRILDLAISMSWSNPEDIAKTLALTASASLASKFCLDAERRSAYRESTARDESVCNTDEVIHNFIPYLKEGIQNASATSWTRVIDMQALVNLGTPMYIEILQPLILGLEDVEVSLRTTAISSLSAHLLPQSAMGTVYNLLMPIIENTGEHPDVRSMAFLIMTSWHPGMSWWKHMAIFTWHEPSNHVANLVSSTIQAIADSSSEMAQMASRVLYLAKPAEAISLSQSSSIYLRNSLNADYPEKDVSIVWFANTLGLLPTNVFITYELQRLHGFSSPSKIGLNQNRLEFFLRLLKQYEDQFRYGDTKTESHRDLATEAFGLIEELGINIRGFPMNSPLFIRNDNNFFFAKDVEFFKGRRVFGFMQEFPRYLPRTFENIYYDKPIDTIMAYPTDLGLPFIVKYSSQSGFKITVSPEPTTRQSDFPSRNAGSLKFTLQANQETSVSTETIVPWLKSNVGSGVRSEVNIHMPVEVHVAVYIKSFQAVLRLSFLKDDIQLVKAVNHPYTVRYKGLLTTPLVEENDFKQINRYDKIPYSRPGEIFSSFGIQLTSSWKGDFDTPTLTSILSGEFSFLTPALSNWEYGIFYDGDTSDTKEITTIFTYASKPKNSLGESEPNGDSSHDDSPSRFQEGTGDADVSQLGRDLEEAVRSIKQLQDEAPPGSKTSIGINMEIQGSSKHKHNLMFMLVEDTTQEKVNTKLQWQLHRESGEGRHTNNYKCCLVFERPNFLPLSTAEEILNTDFSSSLKSQLYYGESCEGDPIMDVEANFRVTERQMNIVREKLNSRCEYNTEYPVKDIITSQLYDEGNLNIKWTESLTENWKTPLGHLYDTVRGRLAHAGSFDYSAINPKSTIHIAASKNVHTNHWSVETKQHHETSLHKFTLPPFLGFPASTGEALVHHVFNGGNPAICTITSDKVHTFDGENFAYTPNTCWSLSVVDVETGDFIIKVRYTEEFEAYVLWRDRGIAFEMTSSEVKVKEDKDPGPYNLYEVINLGNAMLLTLNNGISIKVSDKVETQMSFNRRTGVSGLCGYFDGERIFDLSGPKECIYHDPEFFAAAWEASGEGCDNGTHQERKSKVEEYQGDCPKRTYIPTGISHVNVQHQCIGWEYQERKEGHCECKAIVPTPVCSSGCTTNTTSQEQITFSCHPEKGHTDVQSNCHLHTYTTNLPVGCRKQ